MGADYYQTESEIASLLADGKVPIGIGENTKIRFVDTLFVFSAVFQHLQDLILRVSI